MSSTAPGATKKILCPVDFSAASERTLVHAGVQYSQASEMVILHIGNPGAMDRGSLLKEQLRHFSRYSGALSAFGCRIRFAVEYGSPAESIIAYAKKHGSDMIVIGSHGENNIHRLLVGSTTEAVMRQAPCPVVVFKSPDSPAALHGISAAL